MTFTTCYCPNPQCTHYGQRGFQKHLRPGEEPIKAFLDCSVPCVKARFQCARAQRTSVCGQRS